MCSWYYYCNYYCTVLSEKMQSTSMNTQQRRQIRREILDSKRQNVDCYLKSDGINKVEERKIKNRESAMVSRENKRKLLMSLERDKCK